MNNPVINECSNQRWYNDKGQLHNKSDPAFVSVSGTQMWFVNGKLHRTGGPAIICTNGVQFWCMNDRYYFNNKSFQKAAKLTDEDMAMIVLKCGNVT